MSVPRVLLVSRRMLRKWELTSPPDAQICKHRPEESLWNGYYESQATL